jgi:hypothetical protein
VEGSRIRKEGFKNVSDSSYSCVPVHRTCLNWQTTGISVVRQTFKKKGDAKNQALSFLSKVK